MRVPLLASLLVVVSNVALAAMPALPQLPAVPDDLPAEPKAVLVQRHYPLEVLQKDLLIEIPLNSAKCGEVDEDNTALRRECRAETSALRDKLKLYTAGVPALQRQINAVSVVIRQCRLIRDAEARNQALVILNKKSAEYMAQSYESRLRGEAILGHFGTAVAHLEQLLSSFVKIDGQMAGILGRLADEKVLNRLRQAGFGGLFPHGIPAGATLVNSSWEGLKAIGEMKECRDKFHALTLDNGPLARTTSSLKCLAATGKTAKFFESYGAAAELIGAEAEHFGQAADALEIVKDLYETKEAIVEALYDEGGNPEGPAKAAIILGEHEEFLWREIKTCEAHIMPALNQ